MGEFYPRIIHGGNLVSFTGMPPDDENTQTIEYNMITTLGFPDMFFDTCTTYPLCLYTKEKMSNVSEFYDYLIERFHDDGYHKPTDERPIWDIAVIAYMINKKWFERAARLF